ncbi:hypothetical protein V6617_08665 [Pelagibacterium nitratireducens]|uniref:RES domain-containing protein n=1 Tax=Pelagibacterium nitratireducens TaxID=1046114 RepID=A0ABZ2I5P1_9HYPH
MIDKRGGEGFDVELLRSWKARAEQEVSDAALLGSFAQRPVWLDKLSTPHYVNLPRVLHFSKDTLSPAAAKILRNGFPETGYIAPELYEAKLILRRLSIKAIDVEQLMKPKEQVREGLTISFYRSCRTLNGANSDSADVETYSYDRSPLVYCKAHGFKYVMPYDPIWVTSNTAVATMRSGNTKLAGIAVVKKVDVEGNLAVCTPLTFGLPDLLGLFG